MSVIVPSCFIETVTLLLLLLLLSSREFMLTVPGMTSKALVTY